RRGRTSAPSGASLSGSPMLVENGRNLFRHVFRVFEVASDDQHREPQSNGHAALRFAWRLLVVDRKTFLAWVDVAKISGCRNREAFVFCLAHFALHASQHR